MPAEILHKIADMTFFLLTKEYHMLEKLIDTHRVSLKDSLKYRVLKRFNQFFVSR
jgi:hypothetical protein